ncbi:hypothetical protein DYQ93_11520 [Xanthomonas sp. LMG 8992]|uniref:spike base protein, RCAP_Rcc01079 family n=1 Tax=Xanthomonas sp. LMG 8992 TaxID=1591157 RepID=UPI00136D8F61|nr:hypothetical protein [Xanthomonas sp. LMG 8992]MXV11649.1 hypothetical protein [Xanthomonas sp. LMG 8992]
MADPSSGVSSPAIDAYAIVPSDGTDLPKPARSLYVGGDGAAVVVTLAGTQVTLSGLSAGSVIPLRVRAVKATGTTASLIALL